MTPPTLKISTQTFLELVVREGTLTLLLSRGGVNDGRGWTAPLVILQWKMSFL